MGRAALTAYKFDHEPIADPSALRVKRSTGTESLSGIFNIYRQLGTKGAMNLTQVGPGRWLPRQQRRDQVTERTTRKHVESAFTHLCKALGKREAVDYKDVGGWRLDHLPGHGWRIEEIINERGAVTEPFGSRRFSAAAFYDVCWFAINGTYAKALTPPDVSPELAEAQALIREAADSANSGTPGSWWVDWIRRSRPHINAAKARELEALAEEQRREQDAS